MKAFQKPVSDFHVLLFLGAGRLALHLATNGSYGFHRDELAMLDDARRLAWGYVAYPPLAPFLGRVSLELFGPSLVGFRFFTALAQAVAMVLTGLIAKEFGSSRRAQVVAAVSAAVAPMALIMGAMYQYIGLDYLWWVLIAYLTVRLVKTHNPRGWLWIGAVIGLGMMTKYTAAFLVAGLVAGVLLTPVRSHLKSPWLWLGALLSVLIFLPNLVWQAGHGFVSLDFLAAIHARDIQLGRTEGYVSQQLFVSANIFTLPVWLLGLRFLLVGPDGQRYRLLGWIVVVPFFLFWIAGGRFYYFAPAFPLLLAAGVAAGERLLARFSAGRQRASWRLAWAGLVAGGAFGAAVMLPIAPVNSPLFRFSGELHDNFVEQIGWPELAAEVARVYASLPQEERGRTGILAGNYGEAGAINLYGPDLGLPEAISGVNSYWYRGYGTPPPENLIVLGFDQEDLTGYFESCELAGTITNEHGVENEETRFHAEIFLCRDFQLPWPEFWEGFHSYA